MRAYHSNILLDNMRDFCHVILRFGVSGAIYSASDSHESEPIGNGKTIDYKYNRRIHRLFFDPDTTAFGQYRNPELEGDVIVP